jgi:PAS domain S-box-containing protein
MSDTHKKLLESRNYLLSVLMSATDAVVSIDKDGAVCFWNAAAHRLFGYSKQEIMGQPVSLLMPERFWNRHDDSVQNFVERGEGRNIGRAIEHTGRKKDGSEFPLELTLGVWRGHGNIFVTGVIRDISVRREKELALRESEERFRSFLEHSSDMVSIWEDEGERIVWANPAWSSALGYTAEEFENPREKIHPDDAAGVLAVWKELKEKGDALTFPQYRFRRADGQYATLETTGSRTEAGGRSVWYFVSRDVTEMVRLRREKRLLTQPNGIVGQDPKMKAIFGSISELSRVNVPVLILGESGTGKELVARAIHNEGPRAAENFVAVNCSALPEGLLESELFGHVRGAFTGAHRDKKGRFELAGGGTIFLDEIGDLSLSLQVKLLRVLQEGTFERVGSEKPTSVDVRLISATNKNLKARVSGGQFREDLYFRINVVPITLPPLRERPGDIYLISDHILREETDMYDRRKGTGRAHKAVKLHPSVMPLLLGHPWPGNVRELQNIIRFALIKCKDDTILPEHLPPTVRKDTPSPTLRVKGSGKLTADSVRGALRKSSGNRAEAARSLGVSRATFYRFLKKHEEEELS